MATPIPLLGYGLGPIPIPALPLAGEINGADVALQASLVAILGLLLVAVLVHRGFVSGLRTTGREGT